MARSCPALQRYRPHFECVVCGCREQSIPLLKQLMSNVTWAVRTSQDLAWLLQQSSCLVCVGRSCLAARNAVNDVSSLDRRRLMVHTCACLGITHSTLTCALHSNATTTVTAPLLTGHAAQQLHTGVPLRLLCDARRRAEVCTQGSCRPGLEGGAGWPLPPVARLVRLCGQQAQRDHHRGHVGTGMHMAAAVCVACALLHCHSFCLRYLNLVQHCLGIVWARSAASRCTDPLRIYKRPLLQVLEFSRTIYEDLSNYDTSGAWPTLIDDYVCHARCRHGPAAVQNSASSPSALAQAGVLPLSIPAHCGAKRLHPDDEAEADALAERLSGLRPCDVDSLDIDVASPARQPAPPEVVRTAPVLAKRRRHRISTDCGSPAVPFGDPHLLRGMGLRFALDSVFLRVPEGFQA